MRQAPLLALAALLLSGCPAELPTPADPLKSQISIRFAWDQPPRHATEMWGVLKVFQDGQQPSGDPLSAYGPFHYKYGDAITARLDIPNGPDRVIVAEFRADRDVSTRVSYWGWSAPFTLERNRPRQADVTVPLFPAPCEDDAEGSCAVAVDGAEDAGVLLPVVNRTRVGLWLRTTGGQGVRVSNQPELPPGPTWNGPLEPLRRPGGNPDAGGWDFQLPDWDLGSGGRDGGSADGGCGAAGCLREVYVQFVNDAGYASAPRRAQVTMDVQAPVLDADSQVQPNPANSRCRLQVRVRANEAMPRPPQVRLVDLPGTLAFRSTTDLFPTDVVVMVADAPCAANGATGHYDVRVSLVDRAGNPLAGGESSVPGGVTLDEVHPEVTHVAVGPGRLRLGSTLRAEFDVEDQGGPPVRLDVTLGVGEVVKTLDCAAALRSPELTHYTCTCAMGAPDGGAGCAVLPEELGANLETLGQWAVQAFDQAGNASPVLTQDVVMDLRPPTLLSVIPRYEFPVGGLPHPFDPQGAKDGVTVRLLVTPSERVALDAGFQVEAWGPDGGVLMFGVPDGGDGFSEFTSVVTPDRPEGDYQVRVRFTDLAGNPNAPADGGEATVRVRRTPPVLHVDQDQVVYVRSPWGDTLADPITGGIPYLGAVHDPLDLDAPLPPGTFQVGDGGVPFVLWFVARNPPAVTPRVTLAACARDGGAAPDAGAAAPEYPGMLVTYILGTELPGLPRIDLPPFSAAGLLVQAMDSAGNLSEPVAIERTEWVATTRTFDTPNPHVVRSLTSTAAQLVPPSEVQGVARAEDVAAVDGVAAEVHSAMAWQQLQPPPDSRKLFAYQVGTFDPARNRVVAYSGIQDGRVVPEWDGDTWQLAEAENQFPALRLYGTMAYDWGRGRAVMMGGIVEGGGSGVVGQVTHEVWEWDGRTWEKRDESCTGEPECSCFLEDVVARSGHAVAYDSWRQQLVVVGGGMLSATALQLATQAVLWDGAAWSRAGAEFDAFHPGMLPAAAFDERHGETVVFGGGMLAIPAWDSTHVWNGSSWREVPLTVRPPGRFAAGMAYDEFRGRVLMFGGCTKADLTQVSQNTTLACAATLDDLWSWDGTTWERVVPAPDALWPPPRSGAVLVRDPLRDQLLLLGGAGANRQPLPDLWAWDGARWEELTPTNLDQPSRANAAAIFNASRDTLLVMGKNTVDGGAPACAGDPGCVDRDEPWLHDRRGWRPLDGGPAAGAPLGRYLGVVVQDVDRDAVLALGGCDSVEHCPVKHNEVQQWDWTSWSTLLPDVAPLEDGTMPEDGGPWPLPRSHAAGEYDRAHHETVMFGGLKLGGTALGDTWRLACPDGGCAWSPLAADGGPIPRFHHAMAWRAAGDGGGAVVLFGGRVESTVGPEIDNPALDDLWEWDGQRWREPARTDGGWPAQREEHSMVSDPLHRAVLVFGGRTSRLNSTSELWAWDGQRWSSLETSAGRPTVRVSAGLAMDEAHGVLWVSGGLSVSALTDLWRLDLVSPRRAAVQLDVDVRDVPMASAQVTGVQVRTRSSAQAPDGGTGVELVGWGRSGTGQEHAGGWVPLVAPGPVPGCPADAGWVCWDSESGDRARPLVQGADQRLSFQVRSTGASRDLQPPVRLDVDYLEVRLRYRLPPYGQLH